MHRPEPLVRTDAQPVDAGIPPARAAERLRGGELLRVVDSYATGNAIIAQLHALLPPPAADAEYAVRRAFRHRFRAAAERLLAPIVEHRVALADGPSIGFLSELYPDHATFELPFVDVVELTRAWNLYGKGVHLAVLGHHLHLFYGTYVPGRTSHLELFGTWLSRYTGPRDSAVDVGTGCGVLALMLAKAGVERVLATDCNPNAVESVVRELRRLPSAPPVQPVCADLLGDDAGPFDLIVFNPPWMQGAVDSPLDRALYFEEGLFERFFDQAAARVSAEGRVVLVFSNVLSLVQPDVPHPIEAELERGRFELVQKLRRKVKGTRRTRERVEVWELRAR